MTGFGDAVAELVREQMRRNAAAIEQACEAALQGGEHGVRVTHLPAGNVRAEVDPSVPYGTLREDWR